MAETWPRKIDNKLNPMNNRWEIGTWCLVGESLRDNSETEMETSERGVAASGELKVKMKPNEWERGCDLCEMWMSGRIR